MGVGVVRAGRLGWGIAGMGDLHCIAAGAKERACRSRNRRGVFLGRRGGRRRTGGGGGG